MEIYDPDTNTWSMGPSLIIPRSNAGLAVLSGRLYIAGGYGSTYELKTWTIFMYHCEVYGINHC